MRKNILIISNSIRYSGAEKSLLDLLLSTHMCQYNFFVIIPNKATYISLFPSSCIILKLPLLFFQRSYNPVLWFIYLINIPYVIIRMLFIIKRYKIDIIYSNTIKAAIYGTLSALFSKRKSIWHVRDNNNSIVEQALASLNHKLICISHYIYRQLRVEKAKKTLIYGGIDTETWNCNLFKDHLTSGTENSKVNGKLVVNISQITPWKNQIDFIRAARKIKDEYSDVHFLIIGDVLNSKDLDYKIQIQKEILKFDLQNDVKMIGFRADIMAIVSKADIVIHPALGEPLGRVVLEAMSMKKPVVAYDCGGPKEIIINGKTGYLVEERNSNQLAQMAIKLLNDSNLADEMGKWGRQRIVELFDIKNNINSIMTTLDNL